MPKLTIDNQAVEVPAGATILEAAGRLGIRIPTLCHLEGCKNQTSCLVCVVAVEGGNRLLPSCATVATEGMKVTSQSPAVESARRAALELLLSDHVGDCIAPCQLACPAHMDIPAMCRHIAAGDLAAAARVVKETIPLPSILGRICPAPCEKACRRGSVDQPISICLLKRLAGDAELLNVAPGVSRGSSCDSRPPADAGGYKKVAVIGAGPAGLAATWFLAKAGHAVTIVDRQEKPGGAMRQIPADRLSPKVLDTESAAVLAAGVTFRSGVDIGPAELEKLRAEFDAVLLATGPAESGKQPLVDLGTVDRHTLRAGQTNVFAAGAMLRPHRMAVRSLAEGHQAAESIIQFLEKGECHAHARSFSCRMGHLQEPELKQLLTQADPATRQTPPGDAGYLADDSARAQAKVQAARCLHCDCRKADNCRLRDWSAELGANAARYHGQRRELVLKRQPGGVVYEPGKCISCGLCVQITQQAGERLGLCFIGRGFSVRVAVPFDEALSAGLEKTARQCVAACPTGALAMDD